jgi:hypothetical protein
MKKQSVAQPNTAKNAPVRRPAKWFLKKFYPFKLLRPVKWGLTTGRRLTKFGQLLLGISRMGDIL